jgi:Raf kinase inhibitor-like YbhB/YbcL family protein
MRVMLLILGLFIAACSQSNHEPLPSANENEVSEMKLSSPAFNHNARIPSRYTCDGANVNPELKIEGLPLGAKSLVLIVDDPDAPAGTWDHWVVWNIVPAGSIAEDSVPGVEGLNSWKKNQWSGPCPPSGAHRYFFKVYALDTRLAIPEASAKKDVEMAMGSHILAKAELIGLYSRQ